MVIYERYMFEFTVDKDMKKRIMFNDKRKIPTHILTLVVKNLKISVEQGRVVTTINIIFCVVICLFLYDTFGT